jgi:biopolymer transport protein ExbB
VNFMQTAINFFQDGGIFLYPLALIFVVGVVIAVERFVYLTRETSSNRALWDEITPMLQSGNFRGAANVAAQSSSHIATMLKYGLSRISSARHRDDVQQAMEESLLEVVPQLEKRTHYLASLANVGLLIGLLGTVVGLIGAFQAVSQANPAEKASLLAAAISVAMNNTASGLFVAITLLLSHMYLEGKTTALVDSLEIAVVKFLNSIKERGGDTAPAPAASHAPVAPPVARPAPPRPAGA